MKLTKGRIHKLLKSHNQTSKAHVQISRKRSASNFTRKCRTSGKSTSSVLNKTMYRSKNLIGEHDIK